MAPTCLTSTFSCSPVAQLTLYEVPAFTKSGTAMYTGGVFATRTSAVLSISTLHSPIWAALTSTGP